MKIGSEQYAKKTVCPLSHLLRDPQITMNQVGQREVALMRARFTPLFFDFVVFGRADGQHVVRVVSACNTLANNGQRAIHAVSVCNTRASIPASVFGGAHAFSC